MSENTAFKVITPQPAVSKLLGPFFVKEIEGQDPIIGMKARPEHSRTPDGHVGGGILVNACDFAMGFVLGKRLFAVQTDIVSVTTVSIAADFISSPKVGEWLEAKVNVLKMGRNICFCECLLYAGDKLVMRSSATFTVVKPQPKI
jgi:acyl-coenzyme A thioesterase PaaI-like protein